MKTGTFPSSAVFGRKTVFEKVHFFLCSLCTLLAVVHVNGSTAIPQLEFDLYFYADGSSAGSVTTKHYTLAGPTDGGRLYPGLRLARAENSNLYFGAERQSVYRITPSANTIENIPLGSISPEMAREGWPMGVGY